MKITLFSLFLFVQFSLFSQSIYTDQKYDQINRLTMTYADTLKTDIYYVPHRKEKQKAPVILLVHGGGFYTGKRDGDLETRFAMEMAGRGYVVASMEYHLTRKGKKEGFGCDCPAPDKIETFKEAVTNIGQAMEYLTKFSREFNFDPDKMVLAGSSAGAEAVLHAAYAKDHPSFNGILDKTQKIAAVISFSGALLDEVSLNNPEIPAFLVHGTDDQLVPYGTAPHHFCAEDRPGYIRLKGSGPIADALSASGESMALYTVEGGGHEWANKGYDLTPEISAFLYKLFQRGVAGQLREVIEAKP
ncbi:alpha/beta hydrolase [Robertkochia marina]|uniref:Alpha/beta hydrolase n=1 Tax=Robertkochia marina TaxID=1227945 RepID=A0A4S3LZE5_9FLAO|nr:alpha/beta hydrolase [Robertkochia marina]THD67464.1 alpha/beta hydrolase [Robertkochia marina]TRZ44667.1 alpha/beta hydrolase [Robertkochia marina]